MICHTTSGVNCSARGCIYDMMCKECGRMLRGQTGNSAHERVNKHFGDWRGKVESCLSYRHSQLYHVGRDFSISVKILKNCFGDPTTRRITKAVSVDELSVAETRNGENVQS